MVRDENSLIRQTLPLELGVGMAVQLCRVVCGFLGGGEVVLASVHFLVGLKEMTLLSGFDQCGPCSYVASVNGKARVRQGKTDSQSLPAGDTAGGPWKLSLNLALSWLRFGSGLVVRDEWEGLARIQCLES